MLENIKDIYNNKFDENYGLLLKLYGIHIGMSSLVSFFTMISLIKKKHVSAGIVSLSSAAICIVLACIVIKIYFDEYGKTQKKPLIVTYASMTTLSVISALVDWEPLNTFLFLSFKPFFLLHIVSKPVSSVVSGMVFFGVSIIVGYSFEILGYILKIKGKKQQRKNIIIDTKSNYIHTPKLRKRLLLTYVCLFGLPLLLFILNKTNLAVANVNVEISVAFLLVNLFVQILSLRKYRKYITGKNRYRRTNFIVQGTVLIASMNFCLYDNVIFRYLNIVFEVLCYTAGAMNRYLSCIIVNALFASLVFILQFTENMEKEKRAKSSITPYLKDRVFESFMLICAPSVAAYGVLQVLRKIDRIYTISGVALLAIYFVYTFIKLRFYREDVKGKNKYYLTNYIVWYSMFIATMFLAMTQEEKVLSFLFLPFTALSKYLGMDLWSVLIVNIILGIEIFVAQLTVNKRKKRR